ncbi:MAG: response regulator transcription factor [Longimicrobiales bacterium]
MATTIEKDLTEFGVPLTNSNFWVLLSALDALEQSFGFHDGMGKLKHANRAYMEEVGRRPDGETLSSQASQLARVVCANAAASRLNGVQRLGEHSVNTERGEYFLQATFLGGSLFGTTSSVLITFTAPRPDPFSLDRLRTHFRLTRAQARVARLLAQGLRNAEIADRLFLSEHTVRHHIEEIRLKVGGHTRAAVASRLQGIK